METRAEILKAADRLFGEVGYDAASTREIAALSGVNKALIHYHFRGKEALFEAVLDDYYHRLNRTLGQALARPGDLRHRVAALIDAYVDFLAHNRNFSRMVQRESAGGKHLDRVVGHLLPMFEPVVKLIEAEYPRTKNGDLAAHHLLISFYGMIVTYFTYQGAIRKMVGADPLSKAELDKRKAHLHRMLEMLIETLEADRTAPPRKKPSRARGKGGA